MSYFDVYKKRASRHGKNHLENMRNQGINRMEREFVNIAGYTQAILNFEKPFEVVIESAKNHLNKYALLRPSDKLNNGDYLSFNNQTWIVRSTDYAYLNPKSELYLCNQILTFKHADVRFPCHIDTSTYGTKGVTSAEKFYESDSKIKLYVQRNEITETIGLGYRFIISHRYVYRVTGMEDVTFPGFFSLTCENEEALEMDDFENNIAYNEGDDFAPPVLELSINGETQIKRNTEQTYRLNHDNLQGKWVIDDESLATIVSSNQEEVVIKTNKVAGWIELKYVVESVNETLTVDEAMLNIMIY